MNEPTTIPGKLYAIEMVQGICRVARYGTADECGTYRPEWKVITYAEFVETKAQHQQFRSHSHYVNGSQMHLYDLNAQLEGEMEKVR